MADRLKQGNRVTSQSLWLRWAKKQQNDLKKQQKKKDKQNKQTKKNILFGPIWYFAVNYISQRK